MTSSSDLSSNTPAKNGRLNYTAGSSWCASTSDSFPYLEIDLQSLHIICAVSTQGNSEADQWVNTYNLQSSTDGTTWTNYTAPGQVGFKSFSGNFNRNTIVKHVLYHGMVGRYVRFVAGSKYGQACLRTEIFGAPRRDIKGNVALFKPTDQSSTCGSMFSSYAVDGGKRTDYSFCAHTGDPENTNPWWRVDLGRVEHVAEVRILNTDCCATQLDGAEIRVGDSTAMGGATNHLCATVSHSSVKQEKSFFCKPIASGRYVSIRISGHPKYVIICEVEVYSTYTHNLALKQKAEQVSTAHDGEASRAVDGDTRTDYDSGTCMHTYFSSDAWWRVDLGASVPVAEVVIVNRRCTRKRDPECITYMDSFQIKIGNNTSTNTSCGGNLSMDTGITKSFYCHPPIVGRFVSVVLPGVTKVLTICEVEVYSTLQNSNGVTACRANPVGISNSTVIRDQRFSASSFLGSSFLPSKGRLNGASAWIPSSTKKNNDYLQIDLGSVYFVCAVATQGNPSADDWTNTYKIETSLDNVNWQMYQENNVVKIFSGNSGRNSIVKSDVYNPLAVKFIRFYPVASNSRKALRVEVYGSMQEVPGKPTVDVSTITASTALVTWHYTPGVDETPVKGFSPPYQTHTFSRLPGGSSSKELTNLMPYTSCTVKIKASSVLGDGVWTDTTHFTTATASAQENAPCSSCSGWSGTILISVVANAALGILLGLSVVCNVYQLRRSKRVSKAGKRYFRCARDVQDTGDHEPVITGGHSTAEPSVCMELQPVSMITNREQVSTNLPNESNVSSQQTYQPLLRAVEYENTGDDGEEVYSDVEA